MTEDFEKYEHLNKQKKKEEDKQKEQDFSILQKQIDELALKLERFMNDILTGEIRIRERRKKRKKEIENQTEKERENQIEKESKKEFEKEKKNEKKEAIDEFFKMLL
jgi:hypothetical protein